MGERVAGTVTWGRALEIGTRSPLNFLRWEDWLGAPCVDFPHNNAGRRFSRRNGDENYRQILLLVLGKSPSNGADFLLDGAQPSPRRRPRSFCPVCSSIPRVPSPAPHVPRAIAPAVIDPPGFDKRNLDDHRSRWRMRGARGSFASSRFRLHCRSWLVS